MFQNFKACRSIVATAMIVICLFLINIKAANCTTFDGVSYVSGYYKEDYNVISYESYWEVMIYNYTRTSYCDVSMATNNSSEFHFVGNDKETTIGTQTANGVRLYNDYLSNIDPRDLDYWLENCSINEECPRPFLEERTYNSCGGWSSSGNYYSAFILSYYRSCSIYDQSAISCTDKLDTQLKLKVNCPNNVNATSVSINARIWAGFQPSDVLNGKEYLINGLPPVSYSGSGLYTWEIPASCGQIITLTPGSSADKARYDAYLVNVKANFNSCDLKIVSLIGTDKMLNPSSGGSVGISGTISDSSGQPISWTASVADRSFSGTGKAPSFSWDGKAASGMPVPDGIYQITLNAKTSGGTCSDTKSIPITVKSVCDLKAGLSGPGKDLKFGAGGTYPITGTYTTSSSDPINWTLTLPDGSIKSGSGAGISATWNGNDAAGTLAALGTYDAVLTVSSSADSTCTSTQKLPITITEAPPGECGFLVSFGSSAHMANGNLSHSQELFSSRGGTLPAGMSFYYNSLDSANGALGRGWSHIYDVSLKQNGDGSVLISEPDWKYKYYTLQNGAYAGQPGNFSNLAKKPDGTFTLTSRDGQVRTFASTGKLITISDRNGNTLSLAYSGSNLAGVTDPAGRTVSFAYDNANHLTSITDPTGNAYTFTVAGNSLASVTQPDSGVWKYTYDANGFMLTKTDPLNNATTYGYDGRHRAVYSADPEGRIRSVV